MSTGPKPRLLSAVFVCAFATAAMPAFAAKEAPQEAQYFPRSQYFQISGNCNTEITPDQAVIVGGVSSSALKPTDAVDQLDKELGLMKSYAAEKHGSMEMLERVRTVKTPQPGREEIDPPFQVIQRLRITFPADAPVDAILQKLIELGFDRFGENVLNNNGNRREAVIRYRVSNFDAKMKDFQQQCTAQAWHDWCNPPTATRNCESQAPPPVNLELQSFNVRSTETLMRPEGNTAPLQWNLGRGQRPPDPPDLLGNVTVHLEGSIFLTYHLPEAAPNP